MKGSRTIAEVAVAVALALIVVGAIRQGFFEKECFATFPSELLAIYPETSVEVRTTVDTMIVTVSKADTVHLRMFFYQYRGASCLYAEALNFDGSYVVVADGAYHEAEFLELMKKELQE